MINKNRIEEAQRRLDEQANMTPQQIIEAAAHRHNFLCSYDPANPSNYRTLEEIREKEMLTEQLIPANLNVLKTAMEQDKELFKFLNTPAEELPEQYKYLVDEVTSDITKKTLLDVITTSLEWNPYGSKIISYFSKSGSKIIGFAGYIVSGNEVTNIKMFSFNLSQGGGMILIRDLDNLLIELMGKYKKVSWIAYPGNPANKIYQKAIEKYGGKYKEINGVIHYSINKNKK